MKVEPTHPDAVCPCSDDDCGCDCVSDWVDCVCTVAPRTFTDDEVHAFREAYYDRPEVKP